MEKKRILVVEDQEPLQRMMGIILTSQGYEVEGVADGQAALDYVYEKLPDLVFLDINLPGINGIEVCRRIKADERSRHIPVIMMTAMNGAEIFAQADLVGADWYLPKPLKAGVVFDAAKRFLR